MSITTALGEQRRTAIVEFVAEYWTVNGFAPSIREVARGIGLHTSSAHHHIVILERAGVLASTPGTMRSLRVTE